MKVYEKKNNNWWGKVYGRNLWVWISRELNSWSMLLLMLFLLKVSCPPIEWLFINLDHGHTKFNIRVTNWSTPCDQPSSPMCHVNCDKWNEKNNNHFVSILHRQRSTAPSTIYMLCWIGENNWLVAMNNKCYSTIDCIA